MDGQHEDMAERSTKTRNRPGWRFTAVKFPWGDGIKWWRPLTCKIISWKLFSGVLSMKFFTALNFQLDICYLYYYSVWSLADGSLKVKMMRKTLKRAWTLNRTKKTLTVMKTLSEIWGNRQKIFRSCPASQELRAVVEVFKHKNCWKNVSYGGHHTGVKHLMPENVYACQWTPPPWELQQSLSLLLWTPTQR